jgi:hypothetical protein
MNNTDDCKLLEIQKLKLEIESLKVDIESKKFILNSKKEHIKHLYSQFERSSFNDEIQVSISHLINELLS